MIQSSGDSGEIESYPFSTIEMTPQDFESLPKFMGF
jgi:hypothetical protein